MTTKKFNFTKAYAELEAIVRDFESRDLDLEKDIVRFEEGMQLAQQLKRRLREIENKIQAITVQFSDEDTPNQQVVD